MIAVAGVVSTTVYLEASGPFTATYLTDRATVWALTDIFADSTAWTYCRVGKSQRNGSKGYLSLRDHYLRPNNVYHMESADKKILHSVV